jgi:NADH-quinone oxidoreductase subunit L
MVAACGVGAPAAAAFHLATHAFFKALLFLAAGSVIHGMEQGAMRTGGHADAQDMRAMGGLASRMPLTFAAFLAGGLSLAGLPLLTAGFWSKDGILTAAYRSSPAVFLALAAAAVLTAFYVARQVTLVFLGRPRTPPAARAAEPSRWMLAPIAFLAVPAVAAGWIGVPADFPVLGGILPDWIGRWIGRVQAVSSEAVTGLMEQRLPICCTLSGPESAPFSPAVLAVSAAVSIGGLLLGWLAHRRYRAGEKDPMEIILGPLFPFLQAGCRLDDLNQKLFVTPARRIADVLVADWIDRRILDGFLQAIGRAAGGLGRLLRNAVERPLINGGADGIGNGARRAGAELRSLQSGRVQEYLLIGLIVFAACGAALMYRMMTVP